MINLPLRRVGLRWSAGIVAAAAFLAVASAQTSVLGPSPGDAYAAASAGGSSNLSPAAGPTSTAPFRWGPFGLRPLLEYQFLHATGLQQSRGHPLTTDMHTVTAGFIGEIGPRWTIEYLPSWTTYSNSGFSDSIEQHLTVSGAMARPTWSAGFQQQYARLNTPTVETAAQTSEQTSITRGTVTRSLPKNLRFSLVGVQSLTFLEKLPDRADWSIAPELDYQLFPSVFIGAGCTVGYVAVYRTADSIYQRPLGHFNWQLTRKTAVDISVGSDRWEFLGRQRTALSSLYYNLDLSWNPVEPTVVHLTALRSDSSGAFRAQLYRSTGWGLTLDQRLLGRLHLDAGVNRQTTTYFGDPTAEGFQRRDKIDGFNLGLRVAFLRHGDFEVFYRSLRNRSNLHGYSFSSDQLGLQIGFKY